MRKLFSQSTQYLAVTILMMVASLFSTLSASAQTLAAGDIAIIGYSQDLVSTHTDEFSIVTLASIPSGTTIYFSDHYWDNTNTRWGNDGLNGTTQNFVEGIFRWVTTSTIPAGTVYKISLTAVASTGSPSVSGLPGTLTIMSGWSASSLSGPFGSSENLFIYQSNNNGVTPSNWVFGWTNALNTNIPCNNCWQATNSPIAGNLTMLPTGLINGVSAVSFAQAGTGTATNPHYDNLVYNIGSLRSGTKAALLSAICTSTNWAGDDNIAYDIAPTSTYFSGANAFFIGSCVTPTTYNVTGGGSYCTGGTGVAVGLANSETGVSYQLKDGSNNNVGPAVSGSTGNSITFGNQTAGTYTVVATRTTGGCTANMTGNATVFAAPFSILSAVPNPTDSTQATLTLVTCAGPYTVYYRRLNGNVSYQTTTSAGNVVTLTGLVPGSQYVAYAVNSINDTTEYAYVTTSGWLPCGAAITGVTTTVNCNQMTVSWNAAPLGNTYTVSYREVSPNLGSSVGGTSTTTSKTFTISQALYGKTLEIIVFYTCNNQYTPASVPYYVTVADPRPQGMPLLNFSNVTCSAFNLSWNAIPGALDYRVQILNGVNVSRNLVVNGTNTSITNLASNHNYGVRVIPRGCNNLAGTMGTNNIMTCTGVVTRMMNELEETMLNVYPNPGEGLFTISATGLETQSGFAIVEVTDILGQRVYSANLPLENQNLLQELDIRNLSAGTYFIRISTETEVLTQKVVKN